MRSNQFVQRLYRPRRLVGRTRSLRFRFSTSLTRPSRIRVIESDSTRTTRLRGPDQSAPRLAFPRPYLPSIRDEPPLAPKPGSKTRTQIGRQDAFQGKTTNAGHPL